MADQQVVTPQIPEGAVVETPPADVTPQGPADDTGHYDIDGEKFSIDDVRGWRDAYENRASWQKALTHESQSNARWRTAVEGAFGKSIRDLDANDLADIQAFGLFNTKLRADHEFARAWQDALTQAYQGRGATPAQAQRQAAQDVAQAKAEAAPGVQVSTQAQTAPQTLPVQVQTQIPPQIDPRLIQRIDRIENLALRRELDNLAGHIENEISGHMGQIAQDIPEWNGAIREMVLHGLLGYDDSELLQMAYSGDLSREINVLADDAVRKVRGYATRALKEQAESARRSKSVAAPTPFKGAAGTPAAEPMPEAIRGRGLNSFADRLRRSLQGPTS